MVCAVRGPGKTLEFAIEEAKASHRPLYLLFVRALPALSEADQTRRWQEDEEATAVFHQAKTMANGHPVFPCYAVSDSVAYTIVDITATMGASLLILGAPIRNRLLHLLRGDVVQRVSEHLPEDIHLLVYA
jgi:nucleotide-binding universal stress UspA family protein